jgi:hypothetical protein
VRRSFVQVDGVLYEKGYEPLGEPAGPMVMPDIAEYRSMIDGSVITSRSRHREHLRQHRCVEIGNDSSVMNPKPRPMQSPPGLKQALIEATNKHWRR